MANPTLNPAYESGSKTKFSYYQVPIEEEGLYAHLPSVEEEAYSPIIEELELLPGQPLVQPPVPVVNYESLSKAHQETTDNPKYIGYCDVCLDNCGKPGGCAGCKKCIFFENINYKQPSNGGRKYTTKRRKRINKRKSRKNKKNSKRKTKRRK